MRVHSEQEDEQEERALLEAIRNEDPKDHGPRRAYASWLAARDPSDPRVERIRLELRLRGKDLTRERNVGARMKLLADRERLRALSKLVGEQACREVPVIDDPCPQCGAQLEWDQDPPYQNVYGQSDPTRCPRCRWSSG